jgi:hypothetical protein
MGFVSTAWSSQREGECGNIVGVYSIHATKKLLDRIKEPVEAQVAEPTTKLGNWYAKLLFWKPQFVLFVNERTFLPVLVPLGPRQPSFRDISMIDHRNTLRGINRRPI